MNLSERIPSLDDKELKSLLANARRLETTGTPKQQADAGEIIPLIVSEMDGRKPPPKPKRLTAKAAAAAAAAAEADADADEDADADA